MKIVARRQEKSANFADLSLVRMVTMDEDWKAGENGDYYDDGKDVFKSPEAGLCLDTSIGLE